jgi:N-methylhydantoinase A
MTGPGGLRVGVDIGGTFTDLCIVTADGVIAVGKALTTSDQPALAVERVLLQTLADAGVDAGDIDTLVHGTTLVTNALIERKGSRTAFLATAGFRDVLEMAREHRYELYDLMIELPTPLVARHLRFDIPERVLADGSVLVDLDEDHVRRLARELQARGIEAVAVCFLHSFTNPAHERRVRDILAEETSVDVAISSDVVPEIREYERSTTTVANVYVQRIAARYLDDLATRLAKAGVRCAPLIMLSNGGLATLATAARYPIRMLESGPAGGVLAAAAFGAANGTADLIAFDMGGTTAKLCLIEDGEPLITHTFEIDRKYRLRAGSGMPAKVPVIDLIEIGVGGGSIARIDALGLLRVGPTSAGSRPGPACYGLGGTEPTVTDADLVLGYLNPDYFLGGRMTLDRTAARRAIQDAIATPLGLSVEDAAWGIHAIVNEDMANAARVHAVERGRDASSLEMFTSGGAGPVHGAGVAAALRVGRVLVPPAAGVMSSIGFLTAPLAFDFVRSFRARTDAISWEHAERLFTDMEAEGADLLCDSGVPVVDIEHLRYADMRFVGQGFEIRVRIAPGAGEHAGDQLAAQFRAAYERMYGRSGPQVPIEVLTWRVVSRGPRPHVRLQLSGGPTTDATAAIKGARLAYFGPDRGLLLTTVHDRYRLPIGESLVGPALIEERESTLVLRPQDRCRVAPDASIIVEIGAGAAAGGTR